MKKNGIEIRTYCEVGCDCPTCHIGLGNEGKTEVEKCVHCQIKWKDKGQYAPGYWDKKDKSVKAEEVKEGHTKICYTKALHVSPNECSPKQKEECDIKGLHTSENCKEDSPEGIMGILHSPKQKEDIVEKLQKCCKVCACSEGIKIWCACHRKTLREYKDEKQSIEEEEWKDVIGYEGLYLVSSKGKVYSYYTDRVLRDSVGSAGYPHIWLAKNKQRKSKNIHRLMAEAFLEKPKDKTEVNHKNGIRIDNNLSNLEWVTSSENTLKAFRETKTAIPNFTTRDLSMGQARDIRDAYERGDITQKALAERYGVSSQLVRNIVHEKTYKVEDPLKRVKTNKIP